MDQSVMVFAGTAARASAIPSPSAGMVAYSTATSLQVYNGSAWVAATTGYGAASGGTAVTISSVNYQYVSITATGSFTPTTAGLFDVLMFAGGGAGGNGNSSTAYAGGGGGGGGFLLTTIYLPASAATITIGAGGAGSAGTTTIARGNVSSLSSGANISLSVMGGGQGACSFTPHGTVCTGGCGGGGCAKFSVTAGLAFSSLNGFNGGDGVSGGGITNSLGGGGGGAGGAATGNSTGGIGYDVSTFIGGSTLNKGVGGDGGGASPGGGLAGTGGTSGSGAAGSLTTGGSSTANTAGGGGGGAYITAATSTSGSGGSGIVYIRWKV